MNKNIKIAAIASVVSAVVGGGIYAVVRSMKKKSPEAVKAAQEKKDTEADYTPFKEVVIPQTTKIFEAAFDEIKDTLAYDRNWENGTGYFDPAVRKGGPVEVILPPGGMARSTDEKGRKIIFIGTIFGTLAIFQRHSKNNGVYVSNRSRELDAQKVDGLGSNLNAETLIMMLGNKADAAPNIGEWLKEQADPIDPISKDEQ
jgi:hypothetical protein